MREIKFRAWLKKEKKMTVPFTLNEYADDQDGEYGAMELGYFFYDAKAQEKHGDILMQYTGLKDKNGKEIYEGDVVTFSDQKPAEVKFGECFINSMEYDCYGFYVNNEDKELLMPFMASELYEVIGNVYENPELLEKNNDKK